MAEDRLQSIVIDEALLAASTRDQEQERQIAIYDLLDGNVFKPEGAEGGPYDLMLSVVDNRLVFDVKGPAYEKKHLLSLSPFKGVLKDYFMVCESYFQAIRGSTPLQIEAIDMGRRGLHNEGSDLLRKRLEGKVEIDHDTARRLFTLICALHWRG
jgi:uncharacterized protein (UPF0262 family)